MLLRVNIKSYKVSNTYKDIDTVRLYLWSKTPIRLVSNSTAQLAIRKQGKLLRSHSFDGRSYALSARENQLISVHKKLVEVYNASVQNKIHLSDSARKYGYRLLNQSYNLVDLICKKPTI